MGGKKDSPGIRLVVKVTPNAGCNEITGYKDEILLTKIAAAPEKGKANKELIDFLAKKLGIRKSSVAIIKGQTSRNKVVLIQDANRDDLIKLVNS